MPHFLSSEFVFTFAYYDISGHRNVMTLSSGDYKLYSGNYKLQFNHKTEPYYIVVDFQMGKVVKHNVDKSWASGQYLEQIGYIV